MSRTALAAGFWYFLIIFLAGFLLGTVRVLVLAPHIGELAAVAVEGPIILAVSWVTCRWLIGKRHVPARGGPRLIMGGSAFGCLMLAEAALALWVFQLSLAEHLHGYREPAHALGLAGQIVFGMFPWVQLKLDTGAEQTR